MNNRNNLLYRLRFHEENIKRDGISKPKLVKQLWLVCEIILIALEDGSYEVLFFNDNSLLDTARLECVAISPEFRYYIGLKKGGQPC